MSNAPNTLAPGRYAALASFKGWPTEQFYRDSTVHSKPSAERQIDVPWGPERALLGSLILAALTLILFMTGTPVLVMALVCATGVSAGALFMTIHGLVFVRNYQRHG